MTIISKLKKNCTLCLYRAFFTAQIYLYLLLRSVMVTCVDTKFWACPVERCIYPHDVNKHIYIRTLIYKPCILHYQNMVCIIKHTVQMLWWNVYVFKASPSSLNPPQFAEKGDPGWEGVITVGLRPGVISYSQASALLRLALSVTLLFIYLFVCLFVFVFLPFLRPLLRHMEVPRLGV